MKYKSFLAAALSCLLLLPHATFAEARVIHRGNPDIKEMALTFDDGYSVEKIRSIVARLNAHNVKGTFFFVGSFIASNKFIVSELEADGHMVVSHSFSHKKFTKLTPKEMVGETENVKIAYTKATDRKILPYFRPPYGAYNDEVLQTLGKNHDLYVVMWTIDTKDWEGRSASAIADAVLNDAGNGKIVLMHTTKHVHTDAALDQMITGLKDQGYSLVRMDEMVAKLPIEQQIPGIAASSSAQNETDASAPNNASAGDAANSDGGIAPSEHPSAPEQSPETQPQRPIQIPKPMQLWRLLLSR